MSSILFVDYACSKPYDLEVLKTQPLGGSEATTVRIAEGLQNKGHQVTVIQHNRAESSYIYKTVDWYPESADIVVCIRSPKMIPLLKKMYPNAKHFFWTQDLPFDNLVNDLYLIRNQGFETIAVSAWHSNEIDKKTGGHYSPYFIHNPVDDSLCCDYRPIDPNKFVFFSSPHKGLKYTFEMFRHVVAKYPETKLYYANPGYYPDAEIKHPNIVNIGQKSNPQILEFIRDAFCVFYPNIEYPETNGIIYEEANTLKIPVLCHDFGAAREVLTNPEEQLVDCSNPKYILERIEKWKENYPSIGPGPFALSYILSKWEEILGLETVQMETDYVEHSRFE